MKLALPSSVTGLFQGTLLLFLLASDVFIHYRLRVVPIDHPQAARGDVQRDAAGTEAV